MRDHVSSVVCLVARAYKRSVFRGLQFLRPSMTDSDYIHRAAQSRHADVHSKEDGKGFSYALKQDLQRNALLVQCVPAVLVRARCQCLFTIALRVHRSLVALVPSCRQRSRQFTNAL